MAMELQRIGQQSAALWGKLSAGKKIAAGAGLAAAIALISYATLNTAEEQYATLYSNLAPEDAGQILDLLKTQAVPYRITANGTALEVPVARVHDLRISLASAGVPRGGGAGFELFDKQTFGTTSFVEQMNYQRAIAGELSRTISSIDSVARARVHLSMKERSLYVKNDEPPSASVVVALRPGRELTPPQVRGIVHLVAAGIQGLVPDRVTVLDDSGAVLWPDDEHHSSDGQRDLERTLKRRISDITDSIVGPGHSVVAVTAELDTAKTERTEELYDKDKVAIRSESLLEEREPAGNGSKITGGISGSRANLPGAPGPETADTKDAQAETKMRMQSTRNFEVNRVVNRIVGPKARLRRIHVAILIDAGSTTSTTSTYGAPKASDLTRIAALAREAAGLDPDRGDRLEVHSIPFAISKEEPRLEPQTETMLLGAFIEKRPMLAGGIAIGVILLLLLAGGTGVRAMIKKKTDPQLISATEVPPLPLSAGEIETAIEGGSKTVPALAEVLAPVRTPRERAIEAVKNEPERAARVLAAWLAEPRGNES